MNKIFKKVNKLIINIKMMVYLILIYIINLSKEEKKIYINSLSDITITIKGKGKQQIISTSFSPNKIYINNILQNYTGSYANNLIEEMNVIKMEWNNPLTSTNSMFSGLKNITNIDLSKFNSSQLTNMDYMFKGCTSLVSINLDNFQTSKMNIMEYVFQNCVSLKSLNLSSFDTSKVTDFHYMFCNCTSLVILDLYNFNTSSCICTYHMFHGCSNLISLNLNSFDTSKVTYMYNMFEGCKSLISLNLNHFSIKKLEQYQNMFTGCNPNITFCINETINQFYSQILNIFKNNCSDPCYINSNNKIIKDKNKCVENCLFDLDYPYEYKNICYKYCPLNTYISSNNDYLCLDTCNYYNYNKTKCFDNILEGYYLNDSDSKILLKCHIKCLNCSLESNLNNLCISCNTENNYYPKLNDNMNNNSFINCYDKIPEGFFLNKKNKIYESCYPT